MSEVTAKPRRRFGRTRRLLLLMAGAYLGVLIVLVALERKFIFHPLPATTWWREKPNSSFQDVTLTSIAGNLIRCWWLPHKGATGAMIYSQGNGGNLSGRAQGLTQWTAALNASALIYDYPGYGHSTGAPTEAGCYAAADAAWDWLTKEQGVAPENITLVGESLGGAMAIDLASRHPHRALVLLKAFTSIPDMASAKFPWLPGRYLVRSRFDNLSKIGQCPGPLFMLHGQRDNLTPFAQGQQLFAAAPGPKEFYIDEAGGHQSPLPGDFFARLKGFLAAQ